MNKRSSADAQGHAACGISYLVYSHPLAPSLVSDILSSTIPGEHRSLSSSPLHVQILVGASIIIRKCMPPSDRVILLTLVVMDSSGESFLLGNYFGWLNW
jgi:hypothetical protein